MADEGRWVDNVTSLPTRNRPVRKTAPVGDSTARLNRTIANVRNSALIPAQTRNQIVDTILDRRNATK